MESIAVVAVPFPVQGHLNGMLHMSLLFASRWLPVHFAAPTQQVRQARARAGALGWDPRTLRSIEFHGFEVPAYASPPPDPAAPTPFPSHLVPMCEAFVAGARAPVAALLSRVSARHHCRVVVLYDRLSSFAALEAARIPNGEAFCMTCVAASYDSSWTDAGRRLLRERGLEAPPVEACTARELTDQIIRTQGDSQSPAFPGVVMNTSRAIEDEFVDVAAQDPKYRGKKIFAVARRAAKPSAARRDDVTNRGWTAATTLQPGLARQAATGVGAVRIVRHDVDAAGRAGRGARRRAVQQQAAVPLGPARRRSRRSTRGGSRRREPAREADLRAQQTDRRYGAGGHRVGAAAGDPGARRHGRVHEPLRLELHHGEPEPRAADARLAHALRPAAGRGARVQVPQGRDPGEALAQARCGELVTPSDVIREAIEKAMASEEGLAMLERAKALRESIVHASTAEGGSSRKDLDDFFAYITR